MRLGHIELFVKDPLESLIFYRDVLGFDVTTVQAETYVWLQLGAKEILLRPKEAQSGEIQTQTSQYHQTPIGLVLYVDDVSATIDRLKEKRLDLIPLSDGCYSFSDPDGHWFQIVNPLHE